jgi:four helix bundle protein
MGADELLRRTKDFALNIIRILDKLPNSIGNNTIKNQLVRSATGMAANYRASIKARSVKEFTARLGVVIEEADESWFWLDLLTELNPTISDISILKAEAYQLTAIFTSSVKTLKRKAIEKTGN